MGKFVYHRRGFSHFPPRIHVPKGFHARGNRRGRRHFDASFGMNRGHRGACDERPRQRKGQSPDLFDPLRRPFQTQFRPQRLSPFDRRGRFGLIRFRRVHQFLKNRLSPRRDRRRGKRGGGLPPRSGFRVPGLRRKGAFRPRPYCDADRVGTRRSPGRVFRSHPRRGALQETRRRKFPGYRVQRRKARGFVRFRLSRAQKRHERKTQIVIPGVSGDFQYRFVNAPDPLRSLKHSRVRDFPHASRDVARVRFPVQVRGAFGEPEFPGVRFEDVTQPFRQGGFGSRMGRVAQFERRGLPVRARLSDFGNPQLIGRRKFDGNGFHRSQSRRRPFVLRRGFFRGNSAPARLFSGLFDLSDRNLRQFGERQPRGYLTHAFGAILRSAGEDPFRGHRRHVFGNRRRFGFRRLPILIDLIGSVSFRIFRRRRRREKNRHRHGSRRFVMERRALDQLQNQRLRRAQSVQFGFGQRENLFDFHRIPEIRRRPSVLAQGGRVRCRRLRRDRRAGARRFGRTYQFDRSHRMAPERPFVFLNPFERRQRESFRFQKPELRDIRFVSGFRRGERHPSQIPNLLRKRIRIGVVSGAHRRFRRRVDQVSLSRHRHRFGGKLPLENARLFGTENVSEPWWHLPMDLVMTARRSMHFARIEPFPSKIPRNVTIFPWPRKTPFPSFTAPPFGPRPSFPSWPSPESEARHTFRSPLRITRIRAPAVRPTSTPPCGTNS